MLTIPTWYVLTTEKNICYNIVVSLFQKLILFYVLIAFSCELSLFTSSSSFGLGKFVLIGVQILFCFRCLQETPHGRKKIIPVGSDLESSPSPESPRVGGGPVDTSTPTKTKSVGGRRTLSSASLRQSLSSQHFNGSGGGGSNRRLKEEAEDALDGRRGGREDGGDDDVFDERQDKKNKSATIGMKLKSSYSKSIGGTIFSILLKYF